MTSLVAVVIGECLDRCSVSIKHAGRDQQWPHHPATIPRQHPPKNIALAIISAHL